KTSFSRIKKMKIPSRTIIVICLGSSESSNASGSVFKNAAPSNAPIAYETRIDSQELRAFKVNSAASRILNKPPSRPERMIQDKVDIELFLENQERNKFVY